MWDIHCLLPTGNDGAIRAIHDSLFRFRHFRASMTAWLSEDKWADVYRQLYPQRHQFTFWSARWAA